jgi:hypothetical protein
MHSHDVTTATTHAQDVAHFLERTEAADFDLWVLRFETHRVPLSPENNRLTPCSRFLPDKLIVAQKTPTFPLLYGILMFIIIKTTNEMLCRMDSYFTKVSEKRTASIFRVKEKTKQVAIKKLAFQMRQ